MKFMETVPQVIPNELVKTIDPFWVIWCPSQGIPMTTHDSLESARNEGIRLARKQPGDRFYVLSGIEAFETAYPMVFSIPVIASGQKEDKW